MSLMNRNIPQLYNGVSRQPPILRSIDQTEAELNSWAKISSGVGKRPPTETVAKIADTISDDAFLHLINRDVTERYQVVIADGTIKVVGFDGVERTVNAPGGLSYLAGNNLAAVSVADYTFIVNRDVAVAMKAVGADEDDPADYLRNPGRIPKYGDDDALIQAGSVFAYKKNPSSSGTLMGRVASIEDLPETAANGTLYEVQGSTSAGFTSFYVVRNGGVWDETVRPGLRNAIDETTMPHCLIREGDGTFTFAPFTWLPRRVGDENTNPLPTFIGRKVRDVLFYQNRLAFLVDENIVFSGAGDFGNFWRNSTLDVIDSDVVDVAVTTANVALLEHAVLFNDGALLIADQTQFALSNGEDGLTPSSVAIRPVTRYTVNKKARPVIMGTEVYFAGDVAGSSAVYEYTRMQDSDATFAADITAHVPGFLPSGLTSFAAGSRSLFAFNRTPNVYPYQLYWAGQEKMLSAWRPWVFRGNVLTGTVVDEKLVLVVEYDDGVFLEEMDLSDNAKPVSQPKQVHLDRRVELTGVYSAGTNTTLFTLPFEVPEEDRADFVAVYGNDHPFPHRQVSTGDLTWPAADTFAVAGNHPQTTCAGFDYEFFIEFSEQFPTDYQGKPLTTGRLQIGTFTVRYSDSAHFVAEVYPYGATVGGGEGGAAPKRASVFTGKVTGSGVMRLGQPAYETGSFSFPVAGPSKRVAIRLTNDTYMGSTFSSAEWEGLFNSRALG